MTNKVNSQVVRLGAIAGGQILSDEGKLYMKVSPSAPNTAKVVDMSNGVVYEHYSPDRMVIHYPQASIDLNEV